MPIHLPARPPVVDLTPRTVLWRVHSVAFDALWFGPGVGNPPKYRFDAPGGEYGICYFGSSPGVAIIETHVRGMRDAIIPRSKLNQSNISTFVPVSTIHALRLEGKALPSFGTSVADVCASDYAECRDLALQAWREHPEIDAIQYRSRWDDSLCWAVFDRAAAKLAQLGTQSLGDPAVYVPALRPYDNIGVF